MASNEQLGVAVIGIDHRHIYGQLEGMLEAGARCVGWWTDTSDGEPGTAAGFRKRFPDVPQVQERRSLLDDDRVQLVLVADVPVRRAERAIEAMRAGKDVMTDKPGCTTHAQLDAVRACVAETGRVWSIDFSERFEVPCVEQAAELVRAGAIGKVVQTAGFGPHRLNRDTRPTWFFEREAYGGILVDIASHQIDQFLYFTGTDAAEVVSASVGNYANPGDPQLEDFGEIVLRGDHCHGYIRVDWYTPDALPTWGDGRLTLLGTEGTIELRKYVDVGGRDGTDHLLLVNGSRCEHIDASAAPLRYFEALKRDVLERTETAMPQAHCLSTMRLALDAQAMATRLGHLER